MHSVASVCPFVCVSVLFVLLKTLRGKFSLVLRRILRIYKQSSYIKVVGSKSRSHEQKRHTSVTKYIHLPVLCRRLKGSLVDSNFTVRMLYRDVH